jgi:hypothetical protein
VSTVHGVKLDMSRVVKGSVTALEVILIDLQDGQGAVALGDNQLGCFFCCCSHFLFRVR